MRRRGESELIVGDEMNGAADAVAGETRQLKGLGHNALAGKGRVAVSQERGHLVSRHVGSLRVEAVAGEHLLGASLAQYKRIDRFQMRRIRHQTYVNALRAILEISRARYMQSSSHINCAKCAIIL